MNELFIAVDTIGIAIAICMIRQLFDKMEDAEKRVMHLEIRVGKISKVMEDVQENVARNEYNIEQIKNENEKE